MKGATTLCRNIYDSGLSSFREFLIMLIAQLYVKIDLLLTYGKHLNDRVISLDRWVWAHKTTIVVSNTYCVVFLFCFSSSYVPYVASFLDYPFLIAPLVFSHVYLILFCFSSSYVLYVASFLDCPFLIAPLVFSHVYLIPPHFIEVPVPSQESERSCICMLVISLWLCFYDFSIGLWNCFRQCGIYLFSIYYCHHYSRSVFIN